MAELLAVYLDILRSQIMIASRVENVVDDSRLVLVIASTMEEELCEFRVAEHCLQAGDDREVNEDLPRAPLSVEP